MQALLVIHSLLRWFILLFGLWTLLSAIAGVAGNKAYLASDSRANFSFMMGMDVQLLVGLALYFVGGWFDRLKDLGNNMHDANLRFFTMEHELMMIIAWILVHVGRVSVKKATSSSAKFKRSLIFFGIAFLLIVIATPWPFREAVARPLMRWF